MNSQIEESKNPINPKNQEPIKHNVLHLTDKHLLKRMEYDKQISPLRGLTKGQKKKEIKMTEEEKEVNRKILYNMNLKLNFVKNPRYRDPPHIEGYNTTIFKPIDSKENPFSVEPKEVVFQDYQPGCIYQMDLKILNRTSLLTSFKYVPPLTENFAIKEVIYPKKDSTLIASGMHAKIRIIFNATSMENFQDELVIITEKMSFKVPLKGIRDKPTLSLANPMDCKKCFIGDRTEMHFVCKNNGGDAHFRFLPVDGDSDNNADGNNINSNELLTIGPFTVFPQEFYLYKGMAQNISVNFSPDTEGVIERQVNLICENSVLNYTLRGEGIKVDVIVKMIDGLPIEETENEKKKTESDKIVRKRNIIGEDSHSVIEENDLEDLEDDNKNNDIGDDSNEKLSTLFFSDTFPYTSTSRILVLKNTSTVSVKFHWTIYDIYHQNEFSIQPDENFFSIEPEEGIFEPLAEKSFTIKFTPTNSVIYEQKLDLVIENIPFPAIKKFVSTSMNIKNTFTKAEPYLPGFNSSFPSYPLYSFTLCGKGKMPCLEVNNNYIDLGEIYIGEEIKEDFEISNPKTGKVKFKVNQIIQKLLKKKPDDNGLSRFYKDRGLQDDLIFKEKKNFAEQKVKIEKDYQYEDECMTDYQYIDVNYLTLFTGSDSKDEEPAASTPRGNSNAISLNVSNELTLQKLKKKKKTISSATGTLKKETTVTSSVPFPIDEFIEIQQNNTFKFHVKIKGDSLGLFKSSLVFFLDDGKSFVIDIIATIIGPKIAVNTPLINFGIFEISKLQKQEFEIENISKIPAKFLIKEHRYKCIHLDNYESYEYLQQFEGEIKEEEVTHKNKIESIIEYENQDLDKLDIEKVDSYKMKFSTCYGELQPGEKKKILVTFYSPYPIHITQDYTIEIEVQDGQREYLNFIAQCEEAEVFIEETMIIPKEIFLSIPISWEQNIITLVNPSNLPVHFKWDNIFEADHRTAIFEPNTGVIEPHSKQEIKFKIVYYFLDHIDDLFICKIDELDIPLGVVVQGDVIGLDIAYEFTEESLELIQQQNDPVFSQIATRRESRRESRRATRRMSRMASIKGTAEDANKYTMKNIILRNMKVNTPIELFFKIKNLSGIPTTFHLNIANYPPIQEKQIKGDKDQTSTVVTKLSKLSRKSKQAGFKVDHPLLTPAIEEINFTSPKGEEFTKQKQIEKDSIFYLSNKKGVAIVVEPKKGRLKPKGEVLIKISFFNECVGDFSDVLTSSIKGLSAVSFPISLKIKGNPLQLSPFQPGINYLVYPQIMKVGSIIRGGDPISKSVRLVNIGTNTIHLKWKIFNNNDIEKPESRDVFKIKLNEYEDNKFKLNFIVNEPSEFPPENKYFTIEPENAVVGPKESIDFNITFHTKEEGEKMAMFIAYPRIEEEGVTKITFNELPLKVVGYGLIPKLKVDKKINYQGNYLYKFYVHSYGKHPKPIRSIILINKEKINMIVDLKIEGPFRIEHTDPPEAHLTKNKYNIIPNSNLKLDVKFLMPSPQNEAEWPMLLHCEKDGKLIVKFQNGETEEYFLKAILKRPRILLSFTGNQSVESSDTIDFGFVNCSCKKVEKMFLMNETDVDSNWKISYVKFKPKLVYGYGTITAAEKEDQTMLDDPSVFSFEQSEGVIYGPTDMLIDLPLGPALPKLDIFKDRKFRPLNIKVMFHPSKNVFYKCRYRIETSTGNSIDFILKGHGSYKEEDIIN